MTTWSIATPQTRLAVISAVLPVQRGGVYRNPMIVIFNRHPVTTLWHIYVSTEPRDVFINYPMMTRQSGIVASVRNTCQRVSHSVRANMPALLLWQVALDGFEIAPKSRQLSAAWSDTVARFPLIICPSYFSV